MGDVNLPTSWISTILEDTAEIHDNLREPVNSSERSKRHGQYPYYGATGQVGWIDDYKQDGEYVLLGEDGAPFFDPVKEKAYLVNGKCWVNNHAHVLRGKNELCLNKYLLYALNQTNYRGYANGTTRLKLTQAAMRKIPIHLAPLNEQNRIVAKIEELFSELDQGIDNLKTAQAQLKVYRQALLKHAFEGKLTAEWRAQNPDKLGSASALQQRIQHAREQRYQQQLAEWQANGKQGSKPKAPKPITPLTAEELAELPELPKGWGWGKWEDILDAAEGAFRRGPFGSALKKEIFVKSGYKVYEQYCPINDDCSYERYYITEDKFKELEGFAVKANDFLISCSGVTLGRITQVPQEYKEGVINQALLRVRINKQAYDYKFFKIFFRSEYFQKRIFENSTGTAIPNVKGVAELRSIPVPILTIVEQEEIIKLLEQKTVEIDQLDQTITNSLQQAEALRQSILKKAFSGELVPQDPNDEPAAALLARIQAEKAAQTTKQGKSGKVAA